MICLEYQDLLQNRLDGDAPISSPEIEIHLSQCPSCRTLHTSAEALLEGLKTLSPPTGPADFAQRLARAVLEDRRLRLRRVRLRLAVTAALAASVLIMAIAGYYLLPVPSKPALPVVKDKKTPDPNDESPHLAKSANDARHAALALSGRWADKSKEGIRMFLATTNSIEILEIDDLPDLDDPLELQPAAQSLRQAGHDVAENFQPFAKSAQRAFSYFLRELHVASASR
jgi:hypothetical protein